MTAIDTSERPSEAPKKESFLHRVYTSNFNFDFIARRKTWYLISGAVLLICIASLLIRGLNMGIDFVGGSTFKVSTTITDTSISDYSDAVNELGLSDMSDLQVTTGGGEVRVQTRSLTSDEVSQVRAALATEAGQDESEITYQLIGPSWGSQITAKGFQALVVFLVAVAVMIAIYFRDWRMSLAALIALLHDLIVTVGVYALVGFTVTPATITGVLTILGYSLYDTVVVFDKVRENTREITSRDRTFADEANEAVNQVFVRSINTTIIGVLPIIAILVGGIIWLDGQGPLPDLGLAMSVGMIAGAWSSIFIATPLLVQMRERQPEIQAHNRALAKKQTRATERTKAPAATTPATASDSAETTTVPEVRITAAPIPDHSAAAGRPQPKREPRSQRKGAK